MTKTRGKIAFDFTSIGSSIFFVYFVGFLTPIAICILMRAIGKKVNPVKVISIYGYAYFIYLLATFIALIQIDVLD